MQFVDRTKLQIKMFERGFKTKDLADLLDITYTGVYNKLNKNRDFSENELCILSKTFGNDIFLDFDVRILRTKKYGNKK